MRAIRLRLTTRRTLLAIAVVALAFAVVREWHYRRLRDRYLRAEAYCWEQAAIRYREQVFCLENDTRNTPYDNLQRQKATDYMQYSLPLEFKGWREEAKDHAGWAAEYRKNAMECAAKKRNTERRNIFP